MRRGEKTSISLKSGWSLPIFAIAIMHDELMSRCSVESMAFFSAGRMSPMICSVVGFIESLASLRRVLPR